MNLKTLFKKFPTEESAIKYLEKARWKDGVVCPYCESKKTSKHNILGRKQNKQCQSCNRSFSVMVNTIFHHTHLDLRYWFYIISLMMDAKKGISAYQVSRNTGIRRGTCWAVMHKIRNAMSTDEGALIKGIFEMDETYVKTTKDNDDKDDNDKTFGGGRSTKNNTPIVAMKEKGGDIKAFATNDTKYHTLGKIAMSVAKIGSEIHTDEYVSYKTFDKFFNHKTCNHSMEFVSKEGIHCNSIEGFWSLLKRGIKGQFHHISKKYLQDYVNEFEYRYNNRQNENLFEDLINRMLVKSTNKKVFVEIFS